MSVGYYFADELEKLGAKKVVKSFLSMTPKPLQRIVREINAAVPRLSPAEYAKRHAAHAERAKKLNLSGDMGEITKAFHPNQADMVHALSDGDIGHHHMDFLHGHLLDAAESAQKKFGPEFEKHPNFSAHFTSHFRKAFGISAKEFTELKGLKGLKGMKDL